MPRVDFSILKDLTLSSITINEDKTEILFTEVNGRQFRAYHPQDCCEYVSVEDICGDLEDLLNVPILAANEVTSKGNCIEVNGYTDESCTWTFYTLSTIKGSVTIRWYGTSNGYYGEEVDLEEISNA